MSETFSVQLTAVFTAILGVGAIVTAVLAFMALRKQSAKSATRPRCSGFRLKNSGSYLRTVSGRQTSGAAPRR